MVLLKLDPKKGDTLDITMHDLRRTAATRLASEPLSIPEHVISRIRNHAQRGVTRKHYVHYTYDKEKREALNAWAARLGMIVSGLRDVSAAGGSQ